MKTKLKAFALFSILTSVCISAHPNQISLLSTRSQLAATDVQRVSLHVTVTDKNGGFVAGLRASDFQISIDKKLAQIVSAEYLDSPVSVGIVFDASGSMVGSSESKTAKTLAALRETLRQFMESGNPFNQYFLIAFNRKPQLLSDWTSEPATIVERFSGLNFYNRTTMYDACYLAVNKLQDGRHAKRALILVSDGQDNSSNYTFKQLKNYLQNTDVLLYSIDLATNPDISSIGVEGRGILDELSSVSGGRAFLARDGDSRKEKDVELAFEALATELRSQYTISVVASDLKIGKKFHEIKAKVNPPAGTIGSMKDLRVRTRKGFSAS